MTMDNETKKEWVKLVSTMDIPVERKEPTEANLRWFIRNAWIRNGSNRNLDAATLIARRFS